MTMNDWLYTGGFSEIFPIKVTLKLEIDLNNKDQVILCNEREKKKTDLW